MTSEKIYNVVLMEDDVHTSELMEAYIQKVSYLKLIQTFRSPVEFMNASIDDEIDIIFMDIQMPQMTGIEFLKCHNIESEIILTTAYSHYALLGYELGVIYYLMKPVELSKFMAATKKAIENRELKRNKSIRQTPKIASVSESKTIDIAPSIMVKVDKRFIRIRVNDIIYIESDWNYLKINTVHRQHITLSTMKSFEEKLTEYHFIRIHKSYIINPNFLQFVEGNMVCVNDVKLQIGRSYKQNLQSFLEIEG